MTGELYLWEEEEERKIAEQNAESLQGLIELSEIPTPQITERSSRLDLSYVLQALKDIAKPLRIPDGLADARIQTMKSGPKFTKKPHKIF